jgi:hypothetical protein
MLHEQEVFRKLPQHNVHIFASSDKTTVGVSLQGGVASCSNAAELICTGTTTPTKENDGNMFYSVTCGEKTYIGPKLYFFAPKEDDDPEEAPVRLHQCRNEDKGVFPVVHFLGFFQKGICDGITRANYDPSFCKSTVSALFVCCALKCYPRCSNF